MTKACDKITKTKINTENIKINTNPKHHNNSI